MSPKSGENAAITGRVYEVFCNLRGKAYGLRCDTYHKPFLIVMIWQSLGAMRGICKFNRTRAVLFAV